ncbi:hypothetical protein NFI96_005477 [Prochilodus magdalenae]|nr:hypothetical protein NFI96_005477 [Prochilodus magdalenae]
MNCILATFTNSSLVQLPNPIAAQSSGSREINKRIKQAIEIRSSELMRKEHITPVTLVFKDTNVEGKFGDGPFLSQHDRTPVHRASSIQTWRSESGVEELDWPAQSPDLHPIEHLWDGLERRLRARPSRPTPASDLTNALLDLRFSQMRDEMFKSNMVCSFLVLLLNMTAQCLMPAPQISPMVIQFLVFLVAYSLVLLVTLAEEFKRTPACLQNLCCWIHETKSIRNLLTLTAIGINFGVASSDILWCSTVEAETARNNKSSEQQGAQWPVNICTYPEFFILSGVLAMVTCAVFLRLSCLLKLAVLMLVIAVYTYLIEVAFHVLFIREHHNGQIQRLSWSDSEWQRVIFSDESRFSLGGDAQRIRVWRHRGRHQDERSAVTRPEDLVSLHLHPYRTICRNCVRMFKLHGMDYHRTPLGTSTAPYRDVWRVGLANTAARRHTERQTSLETTARLDFLWRLQARQEVEDMRELREHNECLLYNILPAHVARHFLERDRNNEDLYSQSYEKVGVMFASIPGFTDYYEQKEMINQDVECLRLLNEIIADFDELLNEPYFQAIEKIKTVGSCYMAASGLSPDKQESEDEWAHLCELVLFALAMQETLKAINKRTYADFRLRVGIAHGPVVAGVIGATKPQYDIWGMTVNLASRMDSTGVSGRIQVPQSTSHILVDRGFVLELRGDIYVKGVSERQGGVRTYFVSSREQRSGHAERTATRRLSQGRNTLAAVVFGLVQARKRETLREANGGFHLMEATGVPGFDTMEEINQNQHDELVLFVNGRKVTCYLFPPLLTWSGTETPGLRVQQVVERNADPEMTLLTFLRRRCILTRSAPHTTAHAGARC